ncbi:hypothetical protein F5884DRAFT_792550 [Xylogone sp. PMI_703]|nr:hypothetical protein F5884DRAFT_792550 [Xylogone sp. PMI_703]
MFTVLEPSRKRLREDDDYQDECDSSGFSAHRFKRHIASLPHRQLNRPASPIQERRFDPNGNPCPAPPTITPADSDSEDILDSTEPRSYFSPWSYSVVGTPVQNSQQSYLSSQMSMSDTAMLSDDSDMAMSPTGDVMHLSPAPYQNDPANNTSSRIPTPIHSSFGPFARLGTGKAPAFRIEGLFRADDDGDSGIMRRRRRLPSPISEGLPSPSVIVEGIEDMQMEVETDSDMPISPLTRPPGFAEQPIPLSITPPQSRPQDENLDPYQNQDSLMSLTTPTKKGHVRSKHTLRNWTGLVPEANRDGTGPKRGFSMGYRSDCEKCRMKVPGHFSHIVTY